MFSLLADGFALSFLPMNLFVMVAGLIIGIIFGALPGFTATMGVAVFVPFSYWLEPQGALLLLSGIYCGGVYGGSIPAILIGIPGTPASMPTAFEGRALTQRGEAGHALAIVTFASAFGGFMSAIALMLFTPLLALIALKVGPPEQMMIVIFGLSVVVMLSKGNMLKGIIVGLLSLLIATIGQDPQVGFPRFTFGLSELTGGVSLVPILIGLFSIPEVLNMIKEIDGSLVPPDKVTKMYLKLSDFTHYIVNYIRSTIIGIIIGIIPAAGPDVGAFLSYNEAKKASKKPEEFGHGSIEGITASEVANNGVTGGSLIPLLTLGIPGSAPAAVFLGAMYIHGLQPGPRLFRENAEIVYTLLVGFGIINILMFFIGWGFCKYASKVLLIPKSILVASIVVLASVGSYAIAKNMFDVIQMFIAGIVGYIMLENDYPVSPVALGLLLGPMLEQAVSQTVVMYGADIYLIFSRPITVVFFFLVVLSFAWTPLMHVIQNKKKRSV